LERCAGRLISLQRGIPDADERSILQRLHTFLPEEAVMEDIESVAALIAALDLVVCIDSTIAHVAGALGHDACVLLPFCPDWRFGFQDATMPWYPSVMLVRQSAPSAWSPVLDALSARLRRR
jgi:ADP-heptose:LPS heptosyltransferase